MLIRFLMLAALTMTSSTVWALNINLGPVTKVEVVVLKPGDTVQILENKVLKCMTMTGQPIKQDVGGWVAMPEEHFVILKRKVEEAVKILEEHKRVQAQPKLPEPEPLAEVVEL